MDASEGNVCATLRIHSYSSLHARLAHANEEARVYADVTVTVYLLHRLLATHCGDIHQSVLIM